MTPPLKITSPWGIVALAIIAIIIGLLAAGVPADWRTDEGFLDTGASLMSDFSLVAYIFVLIPLMIIGFVLARRKMFIPYHQVVMTGIVILNWGLISFIMYHSFDFISGDIGDNLDDTFYVLPAIHAFIGVLAQILGTYLVIRMWFEEELPDALKIKNIKFPMRLTLAGWFIAASLGLATYAEWYSSSGGDSDTAPVSTPEVDDGAPSDADDTDDADAPTVTPTDDADGDDPVATEAPTDDDGTDDGDGDDPVATEPPTDDDGTDDGEDADDDPTPTPEPTDAESDGSEPSSTEEADG